MLDGNSECENSIGGYVSEEFQTFSHIEVMQREDIIPAEKLRLLTKYKKDSTEWEIPRDKISRAFALDLVIDALVNHHNYKRYIKKGK